MSDFARSLPYGAAKPRPHNSAVAPDNHEPAADGPALAVVPDAEVGEAAEGAEVGEGAAEVAAGEAEAAEADETVEASADEAANADGTAASDATAEPDGTTGSDGTAEVENAGAGDEVTETGDEAAAPVAEAEETAEAGDTPEAAGDAEAEAEVEAEAAEPEAPRPGETTIADEVVEKVAGIAARKVPGVYDLGGDASRLVSTVRERIGLGEGSSGRGISVKLSGRAAKLAVTLVVEYGHAVYQVADEVRQNVGDAVEKMLGIEVTELNIVVDDVHVPDA